LAVGLGKIFRAMVVIVVALPADIHSRKLSNTKHNISHWVKTKYIYYSEACNKDNGLVVFIDTTMRTSNLT